jgi:hypothetical protein
MEKPRKVKQDHVLKAHVDANQKDYDFQTIKKKFPASNEGLHNSESIYLSEKELNNKLKAPQV